MIIYTGRSTPASIAASSLAIPSAIAAQTRGDNLVDGERRRPESGAFAGALGQLD